MNNNIIQVIGWAGVVAYVLGYALLSLGKMKADRISYHLLNAFGGICLVIFSYSLNDVPNLVVNLIWIVIATASLTRIAVFRRQRS